MASLQPLAAQPPTCLAAPDSSTSGSAIPQRVLSISLTGVLPDSTPGFGRYPVESPGCPIFEAGGVEGGSRKTVVQPSPVRIERELGDLFMGYALTH